MGLRDWSKGKGKLYNRTESTPYLALSSLTKKYKMNPKDGLVDFGCGRGRVAIYLHDKYKTPVTGIKLNTLAYSEAVKNVELYLDKHEMINERTFVDVYLEVTW